MLDLPADRPRPAVQTYPGDRVTVVLSAELTAALTELSQREGATLFMTLLAAFKILLQRHTARKTSSSAPNAELKATDRAEGLIGSFLTTFSDDLSNPTPTAGPGPQDCARRLCKSGRAVRRLIGELSPNAISPHLNHQVTSICSASGQIDLPDGETVHSFVDAATVRRDLSV